MCPCTLLHIKRQRYWFMIRIHLHPPGLFIILLQPSSTVGAHLSYKIWSCVKIPFFTAKHIGVSMHRISREVTWLHRTINTYPFAALPKLIATYSLFCSSVGCQKSWTKGNKNKCIVPWMHARCLLVYVCLCVYLYEKAHWLEIMLAKDNDLVAVHCCNPL